MLLATTLAVLMSQAPRVDCLSSLGQTKCSKTPWGRCIAAYGQLVCADPAPEVVSQRRALPRLECVAQYGVIRCGYGCVASYGQVKCAATPEGRCLAAYGQITCSEGAAQVRGGRRGAAMPVQPQECLAEYGQTKCGYGCAAGYGQVKCASRPGGRCIAAYGQVTCSD